MSRLTQLLHLDDGEFVQARAAAEAKPLPTPAAPKSPNWGRDIIAFLRAEAPVEPRTLGMRRPVAPSPRPTLAPNRYAPLEYVAHVSMRLVGERYDAVADEVEAMLAELAALAPLTAKAEVAAR